jgi:hypothetical protein
MFELWGLADANGIVSEFSKEDLTVAASAVFQDILSSTDLQSWWLNNENKYRYGPGSLHFRERIFVYYTVPDRFPDECYDPWESDWEQEYVSSDDEYP